MKKNIATIIKKNATYPSLAKKKKLGAFYTPFEVTTILCNWAIRSAEDNILEPSFGGCGFLEASRERLLSLGSKRPTNRLFGCDVDKKAFEHLYEKIGLTQLAKKFIHSDFLSLNPPDFAIQKFDIIIGNPPYISHHNMSARQKKLASKTMKSDDFHPKRLASLWAYFVLHSFKFLSNKGRVAWVLPGSFLYADYSNDIKSILKTEFRRVHIIKLGDRIFLSEGAEESTVILLAEGWKEGPTASGVETSFVSSVPELDRIITAWSHRDGVGTQLSERANLALLSEDARGAYQTIVADPVTSQLGDVANILIGIVTGDNHFFVINEVAAQQNMLPESALTPLLTKFNLSKGINFKLSEIAAARRENVRCLLINTKQMRKNGKLIQYISSYPAELLENNATYNKRSIWHQPNDGRIPDAFFPYMNHEGPRIVLNKARIQCTNTIHRLFYKNNISKLRRKLSTISILSSFSQLSAEIAGRSYGSGALKLEPSEAKKICLILPSNIKESTVDATLKQIDDLFRNKDFERARLTADALLLEAFSKQYGKDMRAIFSKALLELRLQRKRPSKQQ